MHSLGSFECLCVISTILSSVCLLAAGQATLEPSLSAYHSAMVESVNVTCNATPPVNRSDDVAFFVNGTQVFDSTKLNQTAKFVIVYPPKYDTIGFVTKDKAEGYGNVTCIRSGNVSLPVTIFAVNLIKLTVDPSKMTVNSSNKFSCEWKIQPARELKSEMYYAAVEYNATNTVDEHNILARYQQDMPITSGGYAASHWDIAAANASVQSNERFEFSAKSLNASAEGNYACVVNVGKNVKQRFISNQWRTSAGEALSHQFATIILSLLLSLFVACNA